MHFHLHLLHLLRHFLHVISGLLLLLGGLFVLVFVELLRALFHFLLNLLLLFSDVHHGIRVLELLVFLLQFLVVFGEFFEFRIQFFLPFLQLFIRSRFVFGVLREFFLFLGQILHLPHEIFQPLFPLELLELLQRPVQLLFQRLLIDGHLFELFIHLLQNVRTHFLHQPTHLIVDGLQLVRHHVLHQFFELLLLLHDSLLLGAEFLVLQVHLRVLLAQLLELLPEFFLLFEELLNGAFVLPIKLIVLAQLGFQFVQFAPQLLSVFPSFLEFFGELLALLFPLFFHLSRCGCGMDEGGGAGGFGPMNAVIVKDFEPILQHIAGLHAEVVQIPAMHKVPGPA